MNTMTWLQQGAAWAWHTSLVMAVPGLVLLALGRWRGFSARWRMFLAAALLLRLLLPAVPEIPWHPGAPLEGAFSVSANAVPQRRAAHVPMSDGVIVHDSAARHVAPAAVSLHRRISWQTLAATVWGIGVVAVGAWLVGSHWLIRRWIARRASAPDAHVARLFQWSCERMGLQRRVGLVEMPRLATAAVCGWLRPMVLVPENLRQTHTDDEIRGILLHELAHVRRCDVLWSWLGLAACALHWFNPLAWLALRRFHADRELDCDRMALENLTEPQRNAYAPALFKALQCPPPTIATAAALAPFFRHKHEIHHRILTIMKPTKSLAARLAALLFIPALTLLTLTTAGADEEKKPGAADETPVKKQRDGETPRKGPRDGEVRKEGARDGEGEKKGPRDGEVKKEGQRDGEMKKEGARDGEIKKEGVREEEVKKVGARDGEVKKVGTRDGEVKKEGVRDGEKFIKKPAAGDANGKAVLLRVTGNGESILVDGQNVDVNELRGYLSEYVDNTTTIIVEAESTVPYGAVLGVLDAARDSGARGAKLSIGERPREGVTKVK